MMVSSSERDDLVRRVELKLGRTTVRAGLVRETVDRTLGALAEPGVPSEPVLATVVLTASSTPDLASRVRRGLAAHGVLLEAVGVATTGRHTVVVARCPISVESVMRSTASAIGARLNWRTEEP